MGDRSIVTVVEVFFVNIVLFVERCEVWRFLTTRSVSLDRK